MSATRTTHTRLLLIGDVFQGIFAGVNRSDPFYFLEPQLPGRHFVTRRLSVSHRITPEIAEAVNRHLNPCRLQDYYPLMWAKHGARLRTLWGTGLSSSKPRSQRPVQFVKVHNVFRAATHPEIKEFVRTGARTRRMQDLCVLVDSTKKARTPGKVFVDTYTTTHNFLVVESGADRSQSATRSEDRDQLTTNKSVICTVFTAKGLEWPRVLHFSLSGYREPADPFLCLSLAYTAWTRCAEELCVCVDMKTPFCTFRDRGLALPFPVASTTLAVTDLLAFVPVDMQINACVSIVTTYTLPASVPPPMDSISQCCRSELQLTTYEDVSAVVNSSYDRRS